MRNALLVFAASASLLVSGVAMADPSLLEKAAAATGATGDAERWGVTTESDGVGKVASVKSSNPKDFAILRCDKTGKASFILGLDKVRLADNLPITLSGPTTGSIYQAMMHYRADAKIWTTSSNPELIALLSGKDTQLIIEASGRAKFALSLAGSTKAIKDAMVRCIEPLAPATEADVRGFVNNGYAFYYRPLGSEPDAPNAFAFSPDLQALVDRAVENDPGFMGADPFCKCQDFEERRFRHQIGSIVISGERATVKVYVAAFGGPLTGEPVTIEALRLPSGKWTVDDVDGLKTDAKSYAEQ